MGTRDIGPVRKQLLLLFRRHVFPLVRDPIFRLENSASLVDLTVVLISPTSSRSLKRVSSGRTLIGSVGVQERVVLSTSVLGDKGQHCLSN